MRNVEIKARITNYEFVCSVGERLSGQSGKIIVQDDTFYNVNQGRLKMRNYPDSSATLVRYDRANEGGPKLCNYELCQFSSSEVEKSKLLDEMLKKCLGVRGRVIKERLLYMIDQTRLHVDTVQGLGHFMELEVVLRPDQTMEQGQAIAQDLMEKLGIKAEDLIDCAYVDLLQSISNVGDRSDGVLQNRNEGIFKDFAVDNKTDEEKALEENKGEETNNEEVKDDKEKSTQ